MNICEHIEAGHYPTDNKGRALVPMKGGGTVTVLCTDFGYEAIYGVPYGSEGPILWRSNGENWGPYRNCRTADLEKLDLLPPLPRKVKVTAWAMLRGEGDDYIVSFGRTKEEATGCRLNRTIELTGEYEEPWS